MKRRDIVYRGSIEAIGFVFGPESMSEQEGVTRILTLYTKGSQLLLMPDNRWLLLLEKPTRILAELAPGTPLCRSGNLWTAGPDLSLDSQASPLLRWTLFGVKHETRIDELVRLDPSLWIDLGVDVNVGSALEPPPISEISTRPEPSPVDLRSAIGLGELPAKTRDVMRELRHTAETRRMSPSSSRGLRGSARNTRSNVFGPSNPVNPWLANTLAKLVLKSPWNRTVSRKHEAYLNKLSEQFKKGDFENALRSAIPFGGEGADGALSKTALGVPGNRQLLTFTGGRSSAGQVPYGAEVTQMLTNMYRSAANDLESAGRHHEAAYVLSELLNRPGEAVSMLERHHEWKIAAEVAVAFKLDPDLLARLHWLSGNRTEAIALTRRHKNYFAVIEKLRQSSPQDALELRAHWVTDLEHAGDDAQAVQVGWDEPELRPLLNNSIRRAQEAGGPLELSMHAYALSLSASEETRNKFLERLKVERIQPSGGLGLFVETLKKIGPMPDLQFDRQVATAVTREMVASQHSTEYTIASLKALKAIESRTDRLLASDLPKRRKSNPIPREVASLIPLQRGTQPIHDAARTLNGCVLVALGEMGAQLVNERGTIAARWSVPTHSIVMSDAGTKALLITNRHDVFDVHIVDLVTRKLRRYGTVKTSEWADSFDGATWVIAVEPSTSGRPFRTLGFLDMFADEPIIAWQELTSGEQLVAFDRTPFWLAAVVEVPVSLGSNPSVFPMSGPTTSPQLLRWSLPTMRLVWQHELKPLRGPILAIDPDLPKVLHEFPEPSGTNVWMFVQQPGYEMGSVAPRHHVLCTSRDLVVVRPDLAAQATLNLIDRKDTAPSIIATGSSLGPGWRMRSQGQWIVMWDSEGRLCVIDRARGLVCLTASL